MRTFRRCATLTLPENPSPRLVFVSRPQVLQQDLEDRIRTIRSLWELLRQTGRYRFCGNWRPLVLRLGRRLLRTIFWSVSCFEVFDCGFFGLSAGYYKLFPLLFDSSVRFDPSHPAAASMFSASKESQISSADMRGNWSVRRARQEVSGSISQLVTVDSLTPEGWADARPSGGNLPWCLFGSSKGMTVGHSGEDIPNFLIQAESASDWSPLHLGRKKISISLADWVGVLTMPAPADNGAMRVAALCGLELNLYADSNTSSSISQTSLNTSSSNSFGSDFIDTRGEWRGRGIRLGGLLSDWSVKGKAIG